MASQITLFDKFDPNLINFGPVSKNKRGGNVVYLSYGPQKSKIIVQSPPKLYAPFGVGVYEPEGGVAAKTYSLDVSFKGMDTDPKMKRWFDVMTELNTKILSTAVENSASWFGKNMSKTVLEEFYRNLIKFPADITKYAPTMKIKIPCYDDKIQSKFYDENRQPVSYDYVSKGCSVRVLMELKSVWFVNKTFGVTWQLSQCMVSEKSNTLDTFSFQDDEYDDDDDDLVVEDDGF